MDAMDAMMKVDSTPTDSTPLKVIRKCDELISLIYHINIKSNDEENPLKSVIHYAEIKDEISSEYLINLVSVKSEQDKSWFQNENAIKKISEIMGWGANYVNDSLLQIANLYFANYNVVKQVNSTFEQITYNIQIIFYVIKNYELFIPMFIMNNPILINVINRHILIMNNISGSCSQHHFTTFVFQAFCINKMIDQVSNHTMLNLTAKFIPNCLTELFPYQLDTINKMCNIENTKIVVPFTEDKIYNLENLGVYLNYNQSGSTNPIIEHDKLPKVAIKGGLICSEPGLGKTFTTLAVIFSKLNDGIRTLVIVPNIYNKKTWTDEINKHFNLPNAYDYLEIFTFDEFCKLSIAKASSFQRIVIDEIHEMYGETNGNSQLFEKVLEIPYKFCWGLTATPNIDKDSMYNIIRFITGIKTIRYRGVGNFKWIHNIFKDFIIRHTKTNITGLTLPQIIITDKLIDFNSHEQSIYNAESKGEKVTNLDFQRKICNDVVHAVSNSDTNTITPDTLMKLTVNRLYECVLDEQRILCELEKERENIRVNVAKAIEDCKRNVARGDREQYINEYTIKLAECDKNVEAQKYKLVRRNTVFNSYKETVDKINMLIGLINKKKTSDIIVDANGDNYDDIDLKYCCPICYCEFKDVIILFTKCRHYICLSCYERINTKLIQSETRKKCNCCNDPVENGEIARISNSDEQIIGSKNKELLKIIQESKDQRFIVFTQFNDFIKSLLNLFSTNNIKSCRYADFVSMPQSNQDSIQVIVLSSTQNASGIDLSFINNVIIIEPFVNYQYGQEIEKQLIGRVHRINQRSDVVNVYRLIIRNTIEEHIYKM